MGVGDRIREDIQAVFDRDPAARTSLEVVLAYPGLHAIWFHRLAHWLWEHGAKLLGRLVSELSRWMTGIALQSWEMPPFWADHTLRLESLRPRKTLWRLQPHSDAAMTFRRRFCRSNARV